MAAASAKASATASAQHNARRVARQQGRCLGADPSSASGPMNYQERASRTKDKGGKGWGTEGWAGVQCGAVGAAKKTQVRFRARCRRATLAAGSRAGCSAVPARRSGRRRQGMWGMAAAAAASGAGGTGGLPTRALLRGRAGKEPSPNAGCLVGGTRQKRGAAAEAGVEKPAALGPTACYSKKAAWGGDRAERALGSGGRQMPCQGKTRGRGRMRGGGQAGGQGPGTGRGGQAGGRATGGLCGEFCTAKQLCRRLLPSRRSSALSGCRQPCRNSP